MADGHVHRFDRRPQQPAEERTLEHNAVDLLLNHPVTSEGTYVPDIDPTSLSEIKRLSYCEIELGLDGKVDLLAVLAASYAISQDDSAQKYTYAFLAHNCFFFSWTVIMVVSRHHLPYNPPTYLPLWARLETKIRSLTDFIVKEAVTLFLNLVLDTAAVFRQKIDRSIRGGLIAVAWAMPPVVLRFLWKRYFTVCLHMGLRKHLASAVERQLKGRVAWVYQNVETTWASSNSLVSDLWIDEAKGNVASEIGIEVTKILWDAILEAISGGFEDGPHEAIEGQAEESQNEHQLKSSLLGKQSAQFFAVWNTVLVTGITAAKRAGQGFRGTLSDEEMFTRAWRAARDGSFAPARDLVQSTNAQVNKSKRAAMWEQIWRIWNEAWEEAHAIVQPRAVKVVKNIVAKIIDVSSMSVIQEMVDLQNKVISVRVSKKRSAKHPSLGAPRGLTNRDMQT